MDKQAKPLQLNACKWPPITHSTNHQVFLSNTSLSCSIVYNIFIHLSSVQEVLFYQIQLYSYMMRVMTSGREAGERIMSFLVISY